MFTPLATIRAVSAVIATVLAEAACDAGLARGERSADLAAHGRAQMRDPVHRSYVE
jgi:hypothetical protein